jgi:hypothetical protein
MVTLQYGGASGHGFWSPDQRREALAALKERGEFKDGIFSWVDENGKRHNQDAAEACWEYVFKTKVVYPRPRYENVITMDSESFQWMEDESTPGVQRKWLGTFTERLTRIGFVKLDAGASIQLGNERAPEILWLTDGAITYNDETFKRYAAFGTSADEAPQTLKALEEAEMFYVKLPTF